MARAYAADHVFVGATYVELPPNLANQADKRGTIRLPGQTKVEILEVVCVQCRRPYDAVASKPCAAASPETRDHLVGGPSGSSATGERKKRNTGQRQHPYHDCRAVGCTLGTSAVEALG